MLKYDYEIADAIELKNAQKGERQQMISGPIGVFDSGLGGLTTLKELLKLLPGEDIIYLGDTGRVPYGLKSKETIIKYALQDAAFLTGFNIKAMVVACNSVCSSAYDVLKDRFDIPIYEVISPSVKAAALCSKNKKIGVIGTKATIRSGAYTAYLKKELADAQIYSAACPLFVPLVEEGVVAPDDIAALSIAERYLGDLRESGIDCLILACTHYPLLKKVISKVIGETVTLIDSGMETAKLVANDIQSGIIAKSGKTDGEIKYFVTDSTDGFVAMASKFLGCDIRGMVKQVELE